MPIFLSNLFHKCIGFPIYKSLPFLWCTCWTHTAHTLMSPALHQHPLYIQLQPIGMIISEIIIFTLTILSNLCVRCPSGGDTGGYG